MVVTKIVHDMGNMDCCSWVFGECVKMSSDMAKIEEERVMTECPSCSTILASPLTYSGRVRCPNCKQELAVSGDLEIEIANDENFWIGVIVPIIPPMIGFMLATTGILDSSSPGLMGLTCFMCSLLLWPVIGFGLAKSSGTFVEGFRAGARISAIISLIIGGLIWIWFFGFISGGVTN